jgi:hypothetical protein
MITRTDIIHKNAVTSSEISFSEILYQDDFKGNNINDKEEK